LKFCKLHLDFRLHDMKSCLLFLADRGSETFKTLWDFNEYYTYTCKLTALSLMINEFWKSVSTCLNFGQGCSGTFLTHKFTYWWRANANCPPDFVMFQHFKYQIVCITVRQNVLPAVMAISEISTSALLCIFKVPQLATSHHFMASAVSRMTEHIK